MGRQNKGEKTLIDLCLRDYGLRGEETVIGQILITYLSSVEEKEAERIMSEVVKQNDSVDVKRREIVIDCNQLATVIDRSAEMAHSCPVEGFLFLSQDMEAEVYDEFKKVSVYLQKIGGTTASQNRSPKFFDFLYDCYLTTRRQVKET